MDNDILSLLQNSGQDIDSGDSTNGITITALPQYLDNYGFFHVTWDNNEIVVLKNTYSDFKRVLKGNGELSEIQLLIRTLNDCEAVAKSHLKIILRLDGNSAYIKSAEVDNNAIMKQDMRNYMLPRPLTSAEYQMPASHLYDESVILSSGYFGEFMPQVMSYVTKSIFEKLVNLLNPIFDSCNIKTSTPSIVNVHNRVFINMTAFDKMLTTIGLGNSVFRAAHAPHLYIKAKQKFGEINKRYFPVEIAEIDELLDAISKSAHTIDIEKLFKEQYYDYTVQLMILFEYLTISLSNEFGSLITTFGDVNSALSAVYKTRSNSIFLSDEAYNMPEFFDVGCSTFDVKYEKTDFVADTIQSHIAKLPFGKKFGKSSKIEKSIKAVHTLLDIRDSVIKATWKYIVKSKTALELVGNTCVKREKFQSIEDIYCFDLDEVKRLYHDTYYSDTVSTVSARKSRIARASAQIIVPEIFGYDFENLPQISETMIIKAMDSTEHKSLVLNKAENGKHYQVTNDLTLDNYTDKFIAAEKLSLAHLDKYKSAKGFILENVSLFSPVAEYAISNGIALYTGVRFAAIILDKKVIEFKDDLIQIRN